MNDYDEIADLYDTYVNVDFDLEYFLEEAAKVQGAVLELACGTGRLSVPLVEAGVDLTCVDISENMLKVLEAKLRDRGLEARVIHADVCELAFDQQYDLVIFPFHSYAEIVGNEPQRKVLDCVYNSLKAGQKFVCTLLNPTVHRRDVDGQSRVVGKHTIGKHSLVVTGVSRGGDPVVHREQYYEIYSKFGQLQTQKTMKMSYELVEPADFAADAEAAGFSSLAKYGDYRRSPFDASRSPVIVWELVK